MHLFKVLKKRKYEQEKEYWHDCLVEGAERLSIYGSDILVDVPCKAYAFFTDIELKEIEAEKRLEEIRLRCLLNDLD